MFRPVLHYLAGLLNWFLLRKASRPGLVKEICKKKILDLNVVDEFRSLLKVSLLNYGRKRALFTSTSRSPISGNIHLFSSFRNICSWTCDIFRTSAENVLKLDLNIISIINRIFFPFAFRSCSVVCVCLFVSKVLSI